MTEETAGTPSEHEQVCCPTCGLRDWRSALVSNGGAHLCDDPWHDIRQLEREVAALTTQRDALLQAFEDYMMGELSVDAATEFIKEYRK